MQQLCKLKKIFREIYKFESELKKKTGLSINEALALCSLEETRVSSGELAHELGLSPGRMSRILGVLENEGFVCRTISEDDKRVMFFEITPLGREKLAHMHANRVCAPNFEGI